MDDYQISAFIDDQLNLEEKIEFVECVHSDRSFKEEAISLLRQEMRLRAAVFDKVCLSLNVKRPQRWRIPMIRPLGFFGGGLVTALLLIMVYSHSMTVPSKEIENKQRFVLYQPQVNEAAVIGNFSNWQALEMHRAGNSGYWEITLSLPPGEYRYTFLLDGRRRMPDPTRQEREHDDFGEVNSILTVDSGTSV